MHYSLGRESQSAVEWAKAVGPLVEEARRFPADSLAGFVGVWSKSVSYLGESELYARKAERHEVFGAGPALSRAAWERFERYNSLGIDGLKKAKALLPRLRKQLAAFDSELVESGRDLPGELAEYRSVLFSEFADVEMKRTDAEHLRTLVDDAIKTASRGGLTGLGSWMDTQLGSAIKARRRKDRGAATNFAFWKLAAVIAILTVLGIAFWIHCGWFGCDAYSRSNYITAILTVAGLWWC
jgi:hypothetical protein